MINKSLQTVAKKPYYEFYSLKHGFTKLINKEGMIIGVPSNH